MKSERLKRLKERFPRARLRFLFSVLVSIFVTAVIGTSLFAATNAIIGDFKTANDAVYWTGSFAFVALGFLHIILFFQFEKDKVALRYMHLGFGFIYFVCSLLLFIMSKTQTNIYTLVCCIYVFTNLIQVTIMLVLNHKARRIILSVLLYTFLTIELFIFIGLQDEMPLLSAGITYFVIGVYGLGVIFKESFARLHLKKLIKIVRKTYALEIMLGLVSLIFSVSFAFYVTDDLNYGDALWYSFAIVTTIGFGDISVKSTIGRILSVILGLYGIVVVALITSIIVNFYNETKNLSDDQGEIIEEKVKELEEKESLEEQSSEEEVKEEEKQEK